MKTRQQVVEIAKTWLGTPYHHEAGVKGAGADCAIFPINVAQEAGMMPKGIKIPHYPADWHMHQDEERYLETVLTYCAERPADYVPQPADFLLWKFGKCFSHGAVVVDWPVIIHAVINRRVQIDNVTEAVWLNRVWEPVPERGQARSMRIFTLKQWM